MSFLKKTCSIILVAAVVLATFACIAYSGAFAGDEEVTGPVVTLESKKAAIRIPNASGVGTTDTAAVDIMLATNSKNVKGVQFTVQYDSENLTPAAPAFDLPEGAYAVSNISYDTDKVFVILYGNVDLTDGKLGTLYFDFANPENVKGSAEFDLTVTDFTFSTDGTTKVTDGAVEDGKITAVLFGDVNGDGTIDGPDSTMLLQHLADWKDLPANVDAMDINGDGTIDGPDSTLLLQYLADWSVELGKINN